MTPAGKPHFNLKIVWVEPPIVEIPEEIGMHLPQTSLLAGSLARLGFTTWDEVQAFLNPDFYHPSLGDEIPDLIKAVERIESAIQKGQRIGIWGDFDVDGQTSTTLLFQALKNLGADCIYNIPVRARESHGVNLAGLKSFLDQGVELVVTCDTGITAHDAADYCHEVGIDLIITDHHTLPPELPAAYAIVNPQRLPEGHPLSTLPGVGTAFKVAESLLTRAGKETTILELLDLVALGTVADIAVLTGDARYLVQRGLTVLRQNPRLGIQKILENSGTKSENLNEEHIGFVLGPRLNALGRLSDANPVVEFFTTSDSSLAAIFAARLEGLNNERKFQTEQVFRGALTLLEQDPGLLDSPVLILAHSEWPAGVVGIVASRLSELFYRPVILLTTPNGGIARGSARSIEGIHITKAIAACAELLIGFGGHPMAAGLSLSQENLPAFRRRMAHAVQEQAAILAFEKKLVIHTYLNLNQITLDLVEEMDRLAPFGPGNPSPILAVRDLEVIEAAEIGKTGDHLSIIVQDEHGDTRRVIWWQGSRDLIPETRFDLAFTVRASDYRGQRDIQMEWVNARLTESKSPDDDQTNLPIEIIDYRTHSQPLEAIWETYQPDQIAIWAEGQLLEVPFNTYNRLNIPPCHTLVVYVIPPGLAELAQVLKAATPRRLILCAAVTRTDTAKDFLTKLTGMVRHSLRTKIGKIVIEEVAAALNQTTLAVHLGLEWLVTRGYVRIVERKPGEIILAEGGVPGEKQINNLEADLGRVLQETTAFRSYYLRADPASLLQAIQQRNNSKGTP